jgi:hypothetical protein
MGQSATLYRIDKAEFERLAKEPSGFNIKMTEGFMTFDQNFEGLIFLLNKLSSDAQKRMIHEIFYPRDLLGKKEDLEINNLDIPDDLSFLETESISYLNTEKVRAIKLFLDGIDKQQVSDAYDPKELNDCGIYPRVWHNNESFDQAFNRRHIAEGFDNLAKLFSDATEKENLIVVFVG